MIQKKIRGKFIVFEGIDGAGKTTQAKLLYEFLKEKNVPVVLTKEPTDGKIGRLLNYFLNKEEKINNYALQLLFTADRADHLEKVILPNLKKGKTIICDRYFFSTIAYGLLEINDFFWLKTLNKNFPVPHITFFLDLPVEESLKRIRKKRKYLSLFEKEKVLKKIRQNYLFLKNKFPGVKMINGQLSINEIFEIIKKILFSEKF